MLETKPTEMKDIGVTYNNLCKLLVEIEETINPPKVEEITKEKNTQDIKIFNLGLTYTILNF